MIWQIFFAWALLRRSSLKKMPSHQSKSQIHGWIFLKKKFYFISFYSSFCRASPFHREWPQLVTILTSFDLSFGTKSKSLIFVLKEAIHGRKDLNCKKYSKNWYHRICFSRRFIHGFGFQSDLKIWLSNEVRHKQFFCQITNYTFNFLTFN